MSDLKDAQIAERRERGKRVIEIREALGLEAWEFVPQLNARAKELGVVARFHPSSLSRIETGMRPMTVSEFVTMATFDKRERGTDWLARGTTAKRGKHESHPARGKRDRGREETA